MTKRIVLCADDYGQASTITDAILALVKEGRLSAVSCLVNGDNWLKSAHHLLPFQHKVDIGLHLNLTEGKPLSASYRHINGDQFYSLPRLMKAAFLNQLSLPVIYQEMAAQLQNFKEVSGFLPHFLDGHQHVHQLPGIRKVLIQLYKEYFNDHTVPIRLAKPTVNLFNYSNNIKKIAIRLSGSFFQQALKNANIPHNATFSGVYDFHGIHSFEEYRKLFLYFLHEIKDKGLIMCHPGLMPVHTELDAISDARYHEYQYLNSRQFIDDCIALKIKLEYFNTVT